MGDLLWALGSLLVLSVPLGLSLWALLDAARRPAWAWAWCGRRQAVWLAGILFGILTMVPGLVISSWYLLRVRPVIRDAEQGRLS